MTDVEEFFNEIFMRRWVGGWTAVHSFRRIARSGLPVARSVLAEENLRTVRTISSNPDIFKGDPATREGTITALAQAMTQTALGNAAASIDSASVVFAHSILDGTAYDCCVVTSKIAPEDWERRVSARKMALAEIKGASYEELLRGSLDRFVQELDNDSLPKKIDHLFAICPPPAGWDPIVGYAFDPERIKAFDLLRHDIIHGAGARVVPELESELYYLQQSTVFLMMLVSQRYPVRIDPTYPVRRAARRPT